MDVEWRDVIELRGRSVNNVGLQIRADVSIYGYRGLVATWVPSHGWVVGDGRRRSFSLLGGIHVLSSFGGVCLSISLGGVVSLLLLLAAVGSVWMSILRWGVVSLLLRLYSVGGACLLISRGEADSLLLRRWRLLVVGAYHMGLAGFVQVAGDPP